MRIRVAWNVVAIALLAVALVAGCERRGSSEPFRLVTVDDVARMLADPRVAIVDANPLDVFQRGHVPGARWYRAGPSLASVLPAEKATRLVFYCASPG